LQGETVTTKEQSHCRRGQHLVDFGFKLPGLYCDRVEIYVFRVAQAFEEVPEVGDRDGLLVAVLKRRSASRGGVARFSAGVAACG